jgi:hypothetical protein
VESVIFIPTWNPNSSVRSDRSSWAGAFLTYLEGVNTKNAT